MAIGDLVQKFIAKDLAKEELYFKVGTASEIDLQSRTFIFTPNDDTAPVSDAQLQTIDQADQGTVVLIPKSGSLVLVGFTSAVDAVLLMAEQVDQILITSQGSMAVKVDENLTENIKQDRTITAANIFSTAQLHQFNQGNNGGLIIIASLVDKLNKLQAEVNSLVSDFNTHAHGSVRVGTGFSAGPNRTAGTATAFDKNDFENPTIIH